MVAGVVGVAGVGAVAAAGSVGATGAVAAAGAVTTALAGPVLGRLADSHGQRRTLLPVLAVFVAGLAFNLTSTGSERTAEVEIDEAVNRFAVLPMFVLLGATIP